MALGGAGGASHFLSPLGRGFAALLPPYRFGTRDTGSFGLPEDAGALGGGAVPLALAGGAGASGKAGKGGKGAEKGAAAGGKGGGKGGGGKEDPRRAGEPAIPALVRGARGGEPAIPSLLRGTAGGETAG
jgi:hypothetical protein